MIRRRLRISRGTSDFRIWVPIHLTALPDIYPMPGIPEDVVEDEIADTDPEEVGCSLFCAERRSVRLSLD